MLVRRLAPWALQLITVTAFAQACPPPRFDTFTPTTDVITDGIEYQSANLVRMRLPQHITYIASVTGALGLRYANGIKLTLSLDDGSHSPEETPTPPATSFTDAFEGRTPAGCALIAHWSQVNSANYRAHFSSGPLTVYAFGLRDSQYEFVAINSVHPDLVLRGLVKGMPHAAFETLLSTMTPPEAP